MTFNEKLVHLDAALGEVRRTSEDQISAQLKEVLFSEKQLMDSRGTHNAAVKEWQHWVAEINHQEFETAALHQIPGLIARHVTRRLVRVTPPLIRVTPPLTTAKLMK